MSLKISTHNLCDGFSQPEKIPAILHSVQEVNPDVMIFPEAYREGSEASLDSVFEDLDKQGYCVASQLYNDSDRQDRHGLVMIGRRELVTFAGRVDLGRQALHMSLLDSTSEQPLEVFGVHLDDRNEPARLQQLQALLAYINDLWKFIDKRSVAIGGDLNAMDGNNLRALLLRTAGYLMQPLPKVEPGTPRPVKRLSIQGLEYAMRRFASLQSRLGAMATGDVMRLLRSEGYEDDGEKHEMTMSNKMPIAELDHILAKKARVSEYTVDSVEFTDHRRVSAVVSPM